MESKESRRFLPPGYFEKTTYQNPNQENTHGTEQNPNRESQNRQNPSRQNPSFRSAQQHSRTEEQNHTAPKGLLKFIQPLTKTQAEQASTPVKQRMSKRVSIIAILLSLVIIGVLIRVSALQRGSVEFILAENSRYTAEEIFQMTSLQSDRDYTFEDIQYMISSVQSVPGVSSVAVEQTMKGIIEVEVLFYPPVAMVKQMDGYYFIDKMGVLFEQKVPEELVGEYPIFMGLHSWKGSDYEIRMLLSDLHRIYQELPAFRKEISEVTFDGVTDHGEYRGILYPMRYDIPVVIGSEISGEALQMGWELMERLSQEGSLEEYATLGITEKGVMYKKKEIAHGD